MSEGIDVSEWQNPSRLDISPYDFVIIRTSHGLTEDKYWRQHYANAVRAGKKIGFYHFAETQYAVGEASFFRKLTDGLQYDYKWLDAETGQNEEWVAGFLMNSGDRTGIYSSWDGFHNSMHDKFNARSDNWIAWPNAENPPVTFSVWQYKSDTIDHDRTYVPEFMSKSAPPPPPPVVVPPAPSGKSVWYKPWRWSSTIHKGW